MLANVCTKMQFWQFFVNECKLISNIIVELNWIWALIHIVYHLWPPLQPFAYHFYRTQVSLGSGLWELFEHLLMRFWLMMIPTQYCWWCQYKAIPGYLYSMTYMQAALADGQSKIVGILEVKWNIKLIIINRGIRKQEVPLLEFCKK